jgi:hypothetical protein
MSLFNNHKRHGRNVHGCGSRKRCDDVDGTRGSPLLVHCRNHPDSARPCGSRVHHLGPSPHSAKLPRSTKLKRISALALALFGVLFAFDAKAAEVLFTNLNYTNGDDPTLIGGTVNTNCGFGVSDMEFFHSFEYYPDDGIEVTQIDVKTLASFGGIITLNWTNQSGFSGFAQAEFTASSPSFATTTFSFLIDERPFAFPEGTGITFSFDGYEDLEPSTAVSGDGKDPQTDAIHFPTLNCVGGTGGSFGVDETAMTIYGNNYSGGGDFPSSEIPSSTYDGLFNGFMPSIGWSESDGVSSTGGTISEHFGNFAEAGDRFPMCVIVPFVSMINLIEGVTTANQNLQNIVIGGTGIVPTSTIGFGSASSVAALTGFKNVYDPIVGVAQGIMWLAFGVFVFTDLFGKKNEEQYG